MVKLKPRKALVTGGAGFIGSHLVEKLIRAGWNIAVLDDLCNGKIKNLQRCSQNERFQFIKCDLKNPTETQETVRDVELVFHLAANPEVRVGETDPSIHFKENLVATFNLLEAMRKSPTAKKLIFASTSAIYGEALVLPTPEEYGPLVPISLYGASKLGCEALASSYAHTFNLRTLILRLANVVGPRSTHGVIVDFINRLRANPETLEILGDGTQTKSYLYIDDCISAFLHLTERFLKGNKKVDILNVGASDQVGVKRIAEIVIEQMKLPKAKIVFTGGVDGGRGWCGDVRIMNLSIEKLRQTGWEPACKSEQAIKLAAKALLKELPAEPESR